MKGTSTELDNLMRQWRSAQPGGWTMAQAADAIGVSKSTWSDLENGKRPISLETAKSLSQATGVSLEEITRVSGQPIRRSRNPQERLARADAAASVIPELGLLLDMFPELSPEDADMLLTVAERQVGRRKARE